MRLGGRLRESPKAKSHFYRHVWITFTFLYVCDEAQRYDENEYEWLRDVHDHLDRVQIRLFTFLVGQQELLAVKTALQRAKRIQIVARLMVEELAFHGLRDVGEVATCLSGYDQTSFPRASDWSFTRFHLPQAVDAGYRLVDDAPLLWTAFEQLHHKHGLLGELEIPMESFARAVEIVLTLPTIYLGRPMDTHVVRPTLGSSAHRPWERDQILGQPLHALHVAADCQVHSIAR